MVPAVRSTWLRLALLSLVLLAAASCKSGSDGYVTAPAPAPAPAPARELDSGDLAAGAVYQHRFQAAGTFAYHCIHHAGMTGSVVVNESAPDSVVHLSIVALSFPAASVRPGGRVVWTNNTDMVHTVTSN